MSEFAEQDERERRDQQDQRGRRGRLERRVPGDQTVPEDGSGNGRGNADGDADEDGEGRRETLRLVLESMVPEFGPGLFALVTEHGRPTFAGAAGTAEVGTERRIQADDRFRIGGVTQTFVAALVLQLAGDGGALSLDDTVERWLPGAVPGGERITVEHLLRMRSGLPHQVPALLGGRPDGSVYARYHAPEELVARAVAAGARHEPGARHAYSSTNYVLLGLIAERATGRRLGALLWERIFAPLDLDDTDFPEVDPHLRGPHATGYARVALGAPYVDLTTATPSQAWAAGAIVSTPRDVARFLDALMGGELLDKAAWEAMADTTSTGERRGYGMGLMRVDLPGGEVAYGHTGGGAPGFDCVALRSESGRAVVLYRNAMDLTNPLPLHLPFVFEAMYS
ncbi:serine hydrolase domain-containing protein [Streptomyces sp. 4N509B]|uniref:serine hydrolase domain-containing protein n=1 Tax=Streptomyces sp. 4N509B TaxID=3457413 RepID=UPI003FD04604